MSGPEARRDTDLERIEAALSEGRATADAPRERELQELALALRADAPEPTPAFAQNLDRRMQEGVFVEEQHIAMADGDDVVVEHAAVHDGRVLLHEVRALGQVVETIGSAGISRRLADQHVSAVENAVAAVEEQFDSGVGDRRIVERVAVAP